MQIFISTYTKFEKISFQFQADENCEAQVRL